MDKRYNLALLIGDYRPSTVFPLSNRKPELLHDIYVARYPFGKKASISVKVTKGIVSSLAGIGSNFSNIQIDAELQPDNSGNPVLNEKGKVAGVAVAKLDLKKILNSHGQGDLWDLPRIPKTRQGSDRVCGQVIRWNKVSRFWVYGQRERW